MEKHINSEHQLRKAQSISHVGYWEMDLSKQIIWISDEAISIYGYEKGCHDIQLSRFQISPLIEYRAMLDETLDYLLCYNESYLAEYKIIRADNGILRSVYSKAELELVSDSEQVKVIGIVQDITDRIPEEEEVNNLNSITYEPGVERTVSQEQKSTEEEIMFPVKKTILVAEDDESNFRLIKYFLSRVNAEIIRACNGKEAVEKSLSGNKIDLILMDIGMPVMDGYTAIRLIRETNHVLPIIAQTAYAEDMKRAIECGCNGFISKPFDKKHLLNILGQFI
jgi:CheY-like chemotaxis protein